jgi:hypothetical protein
MFIDHTEERPTRRFCFRFTPAEWRAIIDDEDFLRDGDNNYQPRKLMGVDVEIIASAWGSRGQ